MPLVLLKRQHTHIQWRWLSQYQCTCGRLFLALQKEIKSGHVKSCGCLKEKHGEGRTGKQSVEYRAWCNMKNRCYDPKYRGYKRYGGRGISVYEPWKNSYVLFRDWILETIGRRPNSRYSLDRINNEGNYEPGNLRWATAAQQIANK